MGGDAGPTALVVYDLDGVVTRKDTFTALVVLRLRTSPARFLRALPGIVAMVLGRGPETRKRAVHRITEVALSGLSEDDYSALARTVGARLGGDASWIRREIVERMRRQHAANTRIVVATATEQRLAESLLLQAQAPYDTISASQLAATPTGLRVADHRIGARKVEALRENAVPVAEAEFVTDSVTDLPTAKRAARVTLVGATRRTLERYLSEGLAVRVHSTGLVD
ncbi:haloacid dehalogenase-like hydrolase [Spiractinospora alimapuensis]|uniref:HAD family hydrolase n=1 Tax=Spiractinospora alimapuensis TaxID=2820884 RepID=UPI001F2F2FA5|nr:HAD family hydrolase [Spiractinospora alimapuensis]QVQ53297.1 haloacid dehalogenase-like hydrolase [Spiractinospora alimapuensis]